MRFATFQKHTLIDYPGKIAAIAFTKGCNLRCSFCHSLELVIGKLENLDPVPGEEVLEFLKTRRGKLDGLVITGGEPLIYKDELLNFLREVKKEKFLIKVDTNGCISEVLKQYIEADVVDFWAMDVKAPLNRYDELAGVKAPVESIPRAIKLIRESGADYEFRTTVLKGFHTVEDMKGIGKLIKGVKNYSIQNFRAGKTLDPTLSSANSFSKEELQELADAIEPYVENLEVRENL